MKNSFLITLLLSLHVFLLSSHAEATEFDPKPGRIFISGTNGCSVLLGVKEIPDSQNSSKRKTWSSSPPKNGPLRNNRLDSKGKALAPDIAKQRRWFDLKDVVRIASGYIYNSSETNRFILFFLTWQHLIDANGRKPLRFNFESDYFEKWIEIAIDDQFPGLVDQAIIEVNNVASKKFPDVLPGLLKGSIRESIIDQVTERLKSQYGETIALYPAEPIRESRRVYPEDQPENEFRQILDHQTNTPPWEAYEPGIYYSSETHKWYIYNPTDKIDQRKQMYNDLYGMPQDKKDRQDNFDTPHYHWSQNTKNKSDSNPETNARALLLKFFGLKPEATFAEAKKAYLKRVFNIHPDRSQKTSVHSAEAALKETNVAWDALKNLY